MNETKERMTAVMCGILSTMQDGDTVAVISHAAAICAYLLNWCTIEVIDKQKKLRKITYHGSIVVNGSIEAPCVFVLEFENERLSRMKYLDKEDSCSR